MKAIEVSDKTASLINKLREGGIEEYQAQICDAYAEAVNQFVNDERLGPLIMITRYYELLKELTIDNSLNE